MYLLSLILGFAAWVLPVAGMFRKRNFTAASLILCAASLYVEHCQTNRLVNRGDWAAIEDTYPGVLFGATVLVVITAVLNTLAALDRKG